MINGIKLIVQTFLRNFGWEIKRYQKTDIQQVVFLAERLGVDLIIDVGANEGQYGQSVITAGYKGRILSF